MQNRLRELRKSKGMTQGLLSLKSGVHRTSIERYETGRNGITWHTDRTSTRDRWHADARERSRSARR